MWGQRAQLHARTVRRLVHELLLLRHSLRKHGCNVIHIQGCMCCYKPLYRVAVYTLYTHKGECALQPYKPLFTSPDQTREDNWTPLPTQLSFYYE